MCMNDIDSETGVLLPNGFVHVTCMKNFSEENVLSCTCETIQYDLVSRSSGA